MTIDAILAQAVHGSLVSWWKVLLLAVPFLPWAWLISAKLEKDAKYFHLNFTMWNSVFLATGVAAIAAGLLIPIFWIGWPVGLIVLWTPIVVYWQYRNSQVPEDQQFHLTGEQLQSKLAASRRGKASREAMLNFIGAGGDELEVPTKDDPKREVHLLAEDLIGPALSARATRVELAVGPNGGVVSQTVDGVRFKREQIPTDAAVPLIDYIKEAAGLDLADHRRKQDGKCKVRAGDQATPIHVTTAGSSSGRVLRVEFNREDRLNKPFDALGLLQPQLDQLRDLEEQHDRHGLVLIGAPAGHGLTTSAYSFLHRHDAYTTNIKTLEREIMVWLDGVDQVQWDPTNPDVDFATNLQSILRRDPDIVLTGEIKDHETAVVAAEPGMDGPLIYVPQRAGTVAEQIRDWVKIVGDVKQATRALRAVTNQRLLRSLCPNCRQPFQPSAEQLQKLGLPADRVKQLHRANGKVQVKNKIEPCPVCAGTGYLGQIGVFEVFYVDDAIRKTLGSGDLKAALAQARRNKMVYLHEAALTKVMAGETTLEELRRVTAGGGSKPEGSAPQPQTAA